MSKFLKNNHRPTYAYPYVAQHIGSREEQQDAFAFSDFFNKNSILQYGYMAVLADGMGGMKNGALAGQETVKTFSEYYMSQYNNDTLGTMINAAKAANEQVRKIEGAGATLCGVVIKDWYLHWVSVGDSHIYLYRKGSLSRLNKEHNYAAVLDRLAQCGKISIEDARTNVKRQALTSYIGIEELKEIDYNTEGIPLMRGDSVLICSDGLYRGLSLKQIARVLKNGAEDVADEMVDKVLKKNIRHQDNITVLIIDID